MLNDDQLDEKLTQSPSANRLTPEHIDSKIVQPCKFIRATDTLTICVVTTVNGFEIVGKSACADPANYNSEIGERVAFDDAKRQLWQLEGYLLRERLHLQKQAVESGHWPEAPADETDACEDCDCGQAA